MNNIWIIGGTTEGRLLAETLSDHGIAAFVSVATEYGSSVIGKKNGLTIVEARMDLCGMQAFIQKHEIQLVLDASHPYAAEVTANAANACRNLNITYKRIVRKELVQETGSGSRWVWRDSTKEAAQYLCGVEGNIFLTTGSKELKEFTVIPDYEKRLYARVLPDARVVEECKAMGIQGSHLIAMQGPFSKEMNLAMFHHAGASWLVTKEAGTAGGFLEKIEAAEACDMNILVIGRPVKESGITMEDAVRFLCGEKHSGIREVTFIGTGMGGADQITKAAWEAVSSSDAVLGASRQLKSMGTLLDGKQTEKMYRPELLLQWLDDHQEYCRPCILFSGDTGFYSGAGKAAKLLEMSGRYKVTVLPGISSLSYLCARLQLSWEDVCTCSLHGREAELEEVLCEHSKVFVLLGGAYSAKKLMERLIEAGYGSVYVTVGEYLSYPEERITGGTPDELVEREFETLCAVLIETERKH